MMTSLLSLALVLSPSLTAHAGQAHQPQDAQDIVPPVRIKTVRPKYPHFYMVHKPDTGTVVVGLFISAAGVPENVHVVQGDDADLNDAAVNAVQQYRYKPATRDGKPIEVETTVTIHFKTK